VGEPKTERRGNDLAVVGGTCERKGKAVGPVGEKKEGNVYLTEKERKGKDARKRRGEMGGAGKVFGRNGGPNILIKKSSNGKGHTRGRGKWER